MISAFKVFDVLVIISAMAAIYGVVAEISTENMQKMSFKPPELTEEDEKSDHMPDYLKCEACLAIAYQVSSELTKYHQKFQKKSQLSELEIIDIFDNLLQNGFEMYGIKSVSGIKHLSGPGLPAENDAGIVQMGGKWPKRLKSLYGFYLGELGEDTIYQSFKRYKESLAQFLCNGNEAVRSQCKLQNKFKQDL